MPTEIEPRAASVYGLRQHETNLTHKGSRKFPQLALCPGPASEGLNG